MSSRQESIIHQVDLAAGAVSEAVVTTVAVLKDDEPTTLPPLYETIDPDALNQLFAHSSDTLRSLKFEYAACEIVITQDGSITVTECS